MITVVHRVKALHRLRPGASWSLNGETLAGLEWLDAEMTRPGDAEIEAAAAAIAAEDAARPPLYRLPLATIYARATEAEAEQLDAEIAKNGARLRGLWRTSLEVSTHSDFWPQLMAIAERALGLERARAVLASPET